MIDIYKQLDRFTSSLASFVNHASPGQIRKRDEICFGIVGPYATRLNELGVDSLLSFPRVNKSNTDISRALLSQSNKMYFSGINTNTIHKFNDFLERLDLKGRILESNDIDLAGIYINPVFAGVTKLVGPPTSCDVAVDFSSYGLQEPRFVTNLAHKRYASTIGELFR